MISSQAMNQRLRSIDALRGFAALAVVASHAILYSDTTAPVKVLWFRLLYVVIQYGFLGVPLFFVISGFCIHLRWAKTTARNRDYNHVDFVAFWRRRMYRLYPTYFVVLCITMGMVVVAYLMHVQTKVGAVYPAPQPRWMFFDFLAHATMLHGLIPLFDKAGGNPPFWTLAREEYFYLMYFVLLFWRRRTSMWRVVIAVMTISVVFPLVTEATLNQHLLAIIRPPVSPLTLWIQWCLGALSAEAYVGLVTLPRWTYTIWLVPVWTTAALLSERYWNFGSALLWGLVFFTLLNYCVKRDVEERWPNAAIVTWLTRVGIFSYSVYLIHNPLRAVTKFLLTHFFGLPSTPAPYLLAAVISFVVGYFGAKVLFWAVERHFLFGVAAHTPVPQRSASVAPSLEAFTE